MIAGTVVTRAGLAHARVLARSFARHHPGDALSILVVDDIEGRVVADGEPFHVVTVGDIGIERDELHRMALLFGRQITVALKPWLLDHLLGQHSGAATYLDSHAMIFDSLAQVGDAAASCGVLLVPHVLDPLPRDGLDPDETAILGTGIFSSGIYGVGPTNGGFIEFLKERLRRECLVDIPHMRVLDQRWLDFVPSLFPYRVERDRGVNVAYWNLHERPLTMAGGRILAGGAFLRSFNFWGFDPRLDGMIGRSEASEAPRVTASADPVLAELCEEYRRELLASGFDELHTIPFAFDALAGGVPIYDSLRTMFADALNAAETAHTPRPPDPFDPACASEFRAWAHDAYAKAGLRVPELLLDAPRSPTPAPSDGGLRSRFRRRVRRLGSDGVSRVPSGSQHGPVVDRLASLQTGPAGWWGQSMIQIDQTNEGTIASGPLGRLDPGRYRVTVELAPGPRQMGLSEHDQALVVEITTGGYMLGGGAATFGDIEVGTVGVEFSLPRNLMRESLSAGTEVRVRSRGQVAGALEAVLIERGGDTVADVPARFEWLPTMDAGEAGRRAGFEVNALEDRGGTVVSGPHWRLSSGRYLTRLRTRLAGDDTTVDTAEERSAAPVAVVDVVEGDSVLAEVRLSRKDLSDGLTVVSFEVAGIHADPGARVGVRFRTEEAVAAVIESVEVELAE